MYAFFHFFVKVLKEVNVEQIAALRSYLIRVYCVLFGDSSRAGELITFSKVELEIKPYF